MSKALEKEYHIGRLNRIDWSYRLNRRSQEIIKVIKKFKNYKNQICLDIGTSDAIMLSRMNNVFKFKKAYGIDISEVLLKYNKDKNLDLKIMKAEDLKFEKSSIDLITIAAVIEHTDNAKKMLNQCFKVLKKNGIVVITAPNPMFDKIATLIGYEKKDEHVEEFSMEKMKKYLKQTNFKVIHTKYFMFFPFFKIPFEDTIEKIINKLGFGKIMTNQIVVGKKI